MEKCKSHGINHYVSKPFEPDKFIETILDVLNLHESNLEEPGQKETDSESVLDTEDGIKRIGGDAELYRMILKEYFVENNTIASVLKEKIDMKDYDEAGQIVHKIKSSSGNIGAKSLYEAASELQKFLQKNDEAYILKKQRIFQKILSNLLTEIKNILKE
jgi:two-component system, sensor histidine kinase and response regulator